MALSIIESRFLDEIHEKLDKDYNEFKYYQQLVLDTLNAFHKICEKHNIDYYAAYGTLLGAIRDKGQIPWDYDVDVWVMHKEIERLMVALDKDLPNDYYYVTRYKDSNHRHFMMRITPKGFSSEVIHVDVFWLIDAPTRADKLKRMVSLYNKRRALGIYKYLPVKILEYDQNKFQRLYLRFKKMISGLLPAAYVDSFYYKALNMAESDSNSFTDEYGVILKKEWFVQKHLLTFANGMQFYVPAGYLEILEELYGNWQSYLDISNRINEFQSSLQRIRAIGRE